LRRCVLAPLSGFITRKAAVSIVNPHTECKGWWDHVQAAMGSPSADFAHHALAALFNATRGQGQGLSDEGMNAALAVVDGSLSYRPTVRRGAKVS
jgi:hypothetical protein